MAVRSNLAHLSVGKNEISGNVLQLGDPPIEQFPSFFSTVTQLKNIRLRKKIPAHRLQRAFVGIVAVR